MSTRRLLRPTAAVALGLGLFALAAADDLAAADKAKDAEKYTHDLKTSKDVKVRVTALTELGKLGQIQKVFVADATPYMMRALDDKESKVRAAAAKAVGMIDPDPKEAVPALLKLVKDDKEEPVKLAAIQGLGAMGPNAKDAAKDLKKVVKDGGKDSKLSKAAKKALQSISPRQKKDQ